MDEKNKVYDFNAAYALLNQNVLDFLKTQYPQLSKLECSNNSLIFNNESFQLGYFRLNQVTAIICELSAKDFYQVVKIIAEVENNIALENDYLTLISEKLSYNKLTDEDKKAIYDFANKYINLKNIEDYLNGNSAITLSKYRQIINNILYLSNPSNLTEGQKIVTEQILSEAENVGGRGNSLTRTLKNPDIPNTAPDDEQNYSKAGFASIILIIYTIINAAIILAIQFIK